MLENIDRIEAISREDLYARYLSKQKPVIITNLFEGQPIREVDSVDKARRLFGDMPVVVQEGHEEFFKRSLDALMTGSPITMQERHQSTVSGYLDYVAEHPATRLNCAEVPESMIRDVLERCQMPDYCKAPSGELDDVTPMLWFANAGNYTHLHFDADYRHILQYQICGAKRAILAPVSSSRKLVPIRNNCAVSPEGLSESEYDDFVRYVGAYQGVVRTGEALLIPATLWHYFEYIETTIALTFHFHRNEYLRFFAERCHVSYQLQAIASHFIDDGNIEPKWLEAFQEIKSAYDSIQASPFEKAREMQRVFDRIYDRHCDHMPRGMYSRPFIEGLNDATMNVHIAAGGFYNTGASA